MIRSRFAAVPDLADAPTSPPGAAAQNASEVHGFTLSNGLQVVVIPDHRAPVATHMVWYKAGSADEEPGKGGIAHFLEHLMFKGTKAHPAGEFSAVVAALGGQENAFTSYDYTAYFQRVPKAALKTVMSFEADRMSNLVLTDEVVDPERDVVLEERRMRTDSDPGAVLSEVMDAAFWLNQPYRMPVIGWEQEIRGLGRNEAIAFYDRFYTPGNAVLVVAGDVTAAEVKALAEETYGAVENRFEPKPRVRPSEPEHTAARRVALADARVRQPMVTRFYLAPSYRTAPDGAAHALEVASVILAGGSTSRLYTALVAEQAVAAGAGGYYWGTALDPSRLALYAMPRPGVTLAALEAALDAQIARFVTDGVTAEELERAKTRLIADTVYERDSQSALARSFGAALTTGQTIADVQEWPARIRAVTAADVQAAARAVLDIRRTVTGWLEAAPEVAA